MPTETELVNAALRKSGGAKRIMDINEPVGAAGIAADIIASERDDLLRGATWNFAVTRKALAALAVTPVSEFQYAFPLPSDSLRLVSVQDNNGGWGAVPYKLETVQQVDDSYVHCILCNAQEVWIRYVRSVTDPNEMASTFRQVLILRMARIFAISIAKSNSLYGALSEELKTALSQARGADGIENYPEPLPEGSWVRSRRGRNRSDWDFA